MNNDRRVFTVIGKPVLENDLELIVEVSAFLPANGFESLGYSPRNS